VATIVARIQGETERPALTSGKSFTEEVAEVLERRIPLYQAAAQEEIDTDDLTPEQIAERIVAIFEGKRG
jgi:shikimate kinase